MAYNPGYSPEQPQLFGPQEYGYIRGTELFTSKEGDTPRNIMAGAPPLSIGASPFTYQNTDSAKRSQLLYHDGDSNGTIAYNGQPAKSGTLYVRLKYLDSVVINYVNPPNLLLRQNAV